MNKILIAYFSATGTTKEAALSLANSIQGSLLFEIKPLHEYTPADLNWRDKSSRSSLEMKDPSFRPEIAPFSKMLISGVETIYLGFPIWWYVEPRIIDTFIESLNLIGVNIIPFATSGGSGIANAVNHLRSLYPTLRILEGRLLN